MKPLQIAPSSAWSARNSSGVLGFTVRPGTVASTCPVKMPWGSKPGGDAVQVVKRPHERARRHRAGGPTGSLARRPAFDRNGSGASTWRRFLVSRRDVRGAQAGARLKSSAVASDTPAVKPRTRRSKCGSSTTRSRGPASTATRNDAPHRANSNPAAAPSDTSTSPSVSSWRISLPRLAPIASRTAISFCRPSRGRAAGWRHSRNR